MEKILRIEETTFQQKPDDWQHFEGWQIITDDQTIKFGISNGQSCCENWGYLITNDTTEEFIGSELLSISVVDTALNNKALPELDYLDSGDAMFVNLETSAGTLQFVAYNAHNGYYGHSGVLVSKQLNTEKGL